MSNGLKIQLIMKVLGKRRVKVRLYYRTNSVCCIFHKKRAFDESSSESSGDSDTSDSDPELSDDSESEQHSTSQHVAKHSQHCTPSHMQAKRRNAYERG